MNAPATSLSRRRFITRLFSESRGDTGLVALDDLRVHTDGVLWAALAIKDSEYFVAGDDGMVFRHDSESWSREVFPSRLPIHALCALGDRIFSVGLHLCR